jgi:hypothetical protein
METKQQLRTFFAAYEKRFNDFLAGEKLDSEGTINSFAPFFVEASPVGIVGGANDKNFKSNIEKGYKQYKNIGTRRMVIQSIDIQIIDDLHAMVKIHWLSEYEKNRELISIAFDVIYFVQTVDGDSKIFAYITGDEQKALKEAGLI